MDPTGIPERPERYPDAHRAQNRCDEHDCEQDPARTSDRLDQVGVRVGIVLTGIVPDGIVPTRIVRTGIVLNGVGRIRVGGFG